MAEQFKVGQRVYWGSYSDPKFKWTGWGHYRVESGVVVSTGPAISTIWADEGDDSPHMETRANDKFVSDRAVVEAEIAPANEKIRAEMDEYYEQLRKKNEEVAEAAEQLSADLVTKRRWRTRR